MRNQRIIFIAVGLLALGACGEKKSATAGGGTTTALEDATAAELARFQAEENAKSRMTIIDAAASDGVAMPAEWIGPTAFDSGPKATANEATAKTGAPVQPVPGEKATPVEEFPSVAD